MAIPTVQTYSVLNRVYDTSYGQSLRVTGAVTNIGGKSITSRGALLGDNVSLTQYVHYWLDYTTGTNILVDFVERIDGGNSVRAAAYNADGGGQGNIIWIDWIQLPTTLTVLHPFNITNTSACVQGRVSGLGTGYVETGFVIATHNKPTIQDNNQRITTHTSANPPDTSLGASFSGCFSNLSAGTTYYYRPYSIGGSGTVNGEGVYYGQVFSFTTTGTFTPSLPTVTTTAVTNITQTQATTGGNVTSDGGAIVTERGVAWNTSPNPTRGNNYIASGSGTGSYGINITGLQQNTTYYIRAYAINSQGVAYGSEYTFSTLAIPLTAVSGIVVSNIQYNSATINFTNPNSEGNYNAHRLQVWTGSSWLDVGETTLTTFNVESLSAGATYSFRIQTYNNTTVVNSNTFTVITPSPAAFNLINTSTTVSTAAINWQLPQPYGTAIQVRVRKIGATQWITKASINNTATSYTITGLDKASTYQCQVVLIGSEYPSNTITFTTQQHLQPSQLYVTTIEDLYVGLQWNNNSNNTNIRVYYKAVGAAGGFNLFAALSNGTTSTTVTGLIPNTQYAFYVANYEAETGIELATENVYAQTKIYFIPAFNVTSYTVHDSTCGGSDGKVVIAPTYEYFYDITLMSVDGVQKQLTNSEFAGLSAYWYKLTATPKPQYRSHYGNQPYVDAWIGIESTDTTMELIKKSVKAAVCGGFGRQRGRIGYEFADSASGSYVFKLFTKAGVLANTQNLVDLNSAVVYAAPPQTYYGILLNAGNGCALLLDGVTMPSVSLMTVEGINRLFLCEYNDDISVNYWQAQDEDYFIGEFDSNFYTSTKIAEINGVEQWYEIPLDNAIAGYKQQLQRGSQGIIFTDSISIEVPHQNNQKWKDLINILSKRYVVVFIDNNEQYWTIGYDGGVEVREYELKENTYSISFIQPVGNKMLAAINEDYVKTQIL